LTPPVFYISRTELAGQRKIRCLTNVQPEIPWQREIARESFPSQITIPVAGHLHTIHHIERIRKGKNKKVNGSGIFRLSGGKQRVTIIMETIEAAARAV
jgi:hypothetical protein